MTDDLFRLAFRDDIPATPTCWTDTPGLTAETLRAAIQQVRDAPLRVCGATEPHVVHPAEHPRLIRHDDPVPDTIEWTRCANCFTPLPMRPE